MEQTLALNGRFIVIAAQAARQKSGANLTGSIETGPIFPDLWQSKRRMDGHRISINGQHIIYDPVRLGAPGADLFDPAALAASGRLEGRPEGGRGSALFVSLEGVQAVLRPYRRGGLLGDLLGDRYVRAPLAFTRPWREFRLLARLHREGLPVPAPLAARVVPDGLIYRGDILVERLTDTETLAEALSRRALDEAQWRRVGEAVGALHRRGMDHADLNAHNVLLAGDGTVHIIDLDRARLRRPGRGWQHRNLQRLERSLRKLASERACFHPLDTAGVEALLEEWDRRVRSEATC